MGLTTYGVAAEPAYLGCLVAIGSRLKERLGDNLTLDDIPEAREVYNSLKNELDEDLLPEEDEILSPPPKPRIGRYGEVSLEMVGEAKRKSTLQWKLTAGRHEKNHAEMKSSLVTYQEKYIVQITSNSTCADFLFVPCFRPIR
jgi:hypothetical protein